MVSLGSCFIFIAASHLLTSAVLRPMVKGRRKSRSKSSGDFATVDCDDGEEQIGSVQRVNIHGEVMKKV